MLLTADCDDITADVIIADPFSRFLSTADGDDITADVIIAAHSFLQDMLTSWLLILDFFQPAMLTSSLRNS
ncbi:hypothetical protein F511_31547 [Dorcoceras hygrometricum]|uniref:Uncharacterized protein n=1 Tax=Dorcoceras hygrometricum TaxID=472368 RepID=A0A2Z7AH15_9LAMI|nr:hypothetical protein F511_31547 [Dorcoceras hygrometricum]